LILGIVINIDPVITRLGSLEIRWYSVAILLAIIAAVIVSIWEGKRKGIQADRILSLAPVALIGGIIGARVFHLFDHWSYYMANPVQIIELQSGGLAIWGALVGGALAVIIYAWKARIPIGKLMDLLVPGLLAAQIIGRFGCIVNGDAYGGPTSLPWGFIYTNPRAMIPIDLVGIPTHPYPVYDMLWNVMTLCLVLKFRKSINQNGILFLLYLTAYAIGRFILTFVRQENIMFWNLQEAQVVSIAIFAAAVATIAFMILKNRIRTVSE
jgi:phosphatidylglycerol:prolipoprotein diacylglycerol transferase